MQERPCPQLVSSSRSREPVNRPTIRTPSVKLVAVKANIGSWRWADSGQINFRLVPTANCLLRRDWSGRRDLNSRLRPWQGRALPLSYSRVANDNSIVCRKFVKPRAEARASARAVDSSCSFRPFTPSQLTLSKLDRKTRQSVVPGATR